MSLVNPGNFTNYSFSIVRHFYYILRMTDEIFLCLFSGCVCHFLTIPHHFILKETLRKLHTFEKRYKQYLHQFSNGFTISHQFFKIGPGNKQASWAISLNMFYKINLCRLFNILYAGQTFEENKGLRDYKRRSNTHKTLSSQLLRW